jgi:hypothetical protein
VDQKDIHINILRGLALALVVISFFIEAYYLSRAFLFFGLISGATLFRKKALDELRGHTLRKNLSDFFLVLALGVGIAFICLSDSPVKAKAAVGVLLVTICLRRYIKTRYK